MISAVVTTFLVVTPTSPIICPACFVHLPLLLLLLHLQLWDLTICLPFPFISFYFGHFKFLSLLFCVPLATHVKLLCSKSNNFWISNFNYTALVLESYACHLLTKRFYVLLLYKIAVNPKRYTGIDRYPKYIIPLTKPVQSPIRNWLPCLYESTPIKGN